MNTPTIIMVLDNVRSMNNVGSIFRSADAFGLDALYLCGMTAQPPHRDIEKTALGATESVTWQYFATSALAFEKLRKAGFIIVAVEQTPNAVDLRSVSDFLEHNTYKGKPLALVVGHEVNGVSPFWLEKVDFCLEVPQWGQKKSLNVAVCAGVVMWELVRGRK